MREITDLVLDLKVELEAGMMKEQTNLIMVNGKCLLSLHLLVLYLVITSSSISRKYQWYVDGQLTSSHNNPNDWGNNLPTSGTLYIGASSPSGSEFKGKLDEVRIYNKSLTSQEVSVLYANSSVQEKLTPQLKLPKEILQV